MENDRGGGMTEDRGGLLGHLYVLAHIGREPCYSRGSYRTPVAAIFQWATARAGTTGGPA